jgi:hypothetical protein
MLTKDNIALFRFVDDSWVELTTTVGEDDGTYIHYSAKTPGFSYFAIAQKEEVLAPVVEESTEEVVEESVEEVTEEKVKRPVWPWVVLILIIAIVGAILYFVLDKRNTLKNRK